jgi:hypothetical protein
MELTMEVLSELLEQELEDAFELKNKKSLHRYILLLTENLTERSKHDKEYQELRGDMKSILVRLEKTQKQMDKRFNLMFGFMSLGFTVLAVLITVVNCA